MSTWILGEAYEVPLCSARSSPREGVKKDGSARGVDGAVPSAGRPRLRLVAKIGNTWHVPSAGHGAGGV